MFVIDAPHKARIRLSDDIDFTLFGARVGVDEGDALMLRMQSGETDADAVAVARAFLVDAVADWAEVEGVDGEPVPYTPDVWGSLTAIQIIGCAAQYAQGGVATAGKSQPSPDTSTP